jgi:hypothetical protein
MAKQVCMGVYAPTHTCFATKSRAGLNSYEKSINVRQLPGLGQGRKNINPEQ